MNSRQIHSTASSGRHQVLELLEAVFVAELLHGSRRLYLVSPWVRDLTLIDNRAGGFRGLNPDWGLRKFGMAELLALLVERGTTVVLVTRPELENRQFIEQVQSRVAACDTERLIILERETLHAKGLVGDDFALSGSMNFTHSGLRHNDELVRYDQDARRVAELQSAFAAEYGARA